MTYRLTTDHAASSHGQPVLVDADNRAYGPADPLDGATAAEYVRAHPEVGPAPLVAKFLRLADLAAGAPHLPSAI